MSAQSLEDYAQETVRVLGEIIENFDALLVQVRDRRARFVALLAQAQLQQAAIPLDPNETR